MVLTAEHLARRYFRLGRGSNVFYAVRDASLSLPPGSLTVLTGRSGSGKSTLLHMLAGLLEPTEGRVALDGEDLYALDDAARSRLRSRHIGVIPQGQTGLKSLTVLENVRLPGLLYGEACAEEQALALLDRVGAAHLAKARPDELSGGELRRMAVARALAMGPGLLLADEPNGGLDDENTRRVLSLLREQADGGAAVLLVTHEPEAASYADHRFHMDGGSLITE
ncbi:MAG: ABC transporter ATP-binding protein [Oscillospiraceae bacterium]|nr:ABC transporter ATP-binding protein [Oscillospiraceae bacterium]